MKSILFFLIYFLTDISFAIDGAEILKKMDRAGEYKTSQMEATMKIINRKGDKTTMKLVAYEKKEGDKSLMRFTYPSRLKGTAILMVGNNIWYYNRRTNRVRLLSKSAKKGSMMGSSFNYDDMSTDYANEYIAEIIKETDNSYSLKIIPKDRDKNYKYLIAEVPKEHYIATKVEYFNKNDHKFKEMLVAQIRRIKGHYCPLKMSMTEITSRKVTHFLVDEKTVEYDIEFKDSIFSERNLKK